MYNLFPLLQDSQLHFLLDNRHPCLQISHLVNQLSNPHQNHRIYRHPVQVVNRVTNRLLHLRHNPLDIPVCNQVVFLPVSHRCNHHSDLVCNRRQVLLPAQVLNQVNNPLPLPLLTRLGIQVVNLRSDHLISHHPSQQLGHHLSQRWYLLQFQVVNLVNNHLLLPLLTLLVIQVVNLVVSLPCNQLQNLQKDLVVNHLVSQLFNHHLYPVVPQPLHQVDGLVLNHLVSLQ